MAGGEGGFVSHLKKKPSLGKRVHLKTVFSHFYPNSYTRGGNEKNESNEEKVNSFLLGNGN